MINYLPFMQIQKESRAYIVLLPFNAPYEECHQVLIELAQQVLDMQKQKQDEAEKERLTKEMENQKAEAEAQAVG